MCIKIHEAGERSSCEASIVQSSSSALLGLSANSFAFMYARSSRNYRVLYDLLFLTVFRSDLANRMYCLSTKKAPTKKTTMLDRRFLCKNTMSHRS